MRLLSALFPLLLLSLVAIPLMLVPGCDSDRPEMPDDPLASDTPAQTDEQRPRDPDQGQRAGEPGADPLADTSRSRTVRPAETPRTPGAYGADIQAYAELQPTEGNDARGSLDLEGDDGSVRIRGTVAGLEPGEHGFHIHEKGDCSAPDASSAGEHFAPENNPHGSPQSSPDSHHAGDLGNIVAGPDGEAAVDINQQRIMLSGPDSVIGRAFIVHENPDDLESQPSGNAGGRVACGEIVEAGLPASAES
ncbi:MAG: superoxide dismutase family protein [Woeseia sp.]